MSLPPFKALGLVSVDPNGSGIAFSGHLHFCGVAVGGDAGMGCSGGWWWFRVAYGSSGVRVQPFMRTKSIVSWQVLVGFDFSRDSRLCGLPFG